MQEKYRITILKDISVMHDKNFVLTNTNDYDKKINNFNTV